MVNTIRESLARGVVSVRFTKADGSERVMLATTRQDLITHVFGTPLDEDRKPAPANLIKVWDTEKSAWRSIREDRIISWQLP